MVIAKPAAIILLAYLIGSIPFGVIVARRMSGLDPRNYGSGKMGGTNVMRLLGAKVGVLVIALDVAKASVAVLLAAAIFGGTVASVGVFYMHRQIAELIAALAVISGHNWPIFLKFRGGRGVATFFGGLVALCPPAAIFGGEALFISAGLTRYVSLGSIVGVVGTYAILVPLWLFSDFPIEYLIYSFVGGLTIIIMHRDNISRLMSGRERKLGEKLPVTDSVR